MSDTYAVNTSVAVNKQPFLGLSDDIRSILLQSNDYSEDEDEKSVHSDKNDCENTDDDDKMSTNDEGEGDRSVPGSLSEESDWVEPKSKITKRKQRSPINDHNKKNVRSFVMEKMLFLMRTIKKSSITSSICVGSQLN